MSWHPAPVAPMALRCSVSRKPIAPCSSQRRIGWSYISHPSQSGRSIAAQLAGVFEGYDIWGSQSIAWTVALFQWLYGIYITIVTGSYFMVYKPTHIWGAPYLVGTLSEAFTIPVFAALLGVCCWTVHEKTKLLGWLGEYNYSWVGWGVPWKLYSCPIPSNTDWLIGCPFFIHYE